MILAEKYRGRIISADSRQIYKRLDIGTAKPSVADRNKVPHYMIDIVEISDNFTAKRYAEMAGKEIERTADDGALPVIVGGSGLYLDAVTKGLFEGPEADADLRQELERDANNLGIEQLHRELSRVDPNASRKISPGDKLRIIRALEVFRLTGNRISELQVSGKYGGLDMDFIWLGITYERQALYERINSRVDRMIVDGLLDEVIGLRNAGLELSLRQKRIVGYNEILDAVSNLISLEGAIELIKQHSRNYAKRQLTWFAHRAPVKWLSADKTNFYDEVFDLIDDYLK